MFAMPGLRGFSLTATRESDGVSCSADGVFIGDVPLLQLPDAENSSWTVRSIAELNKELSARYRLPIDIASKAGALALIATAFNRGDLAMAAIATVQMRFPDPPPLAKTIENREEISARAHELIRSGLLKFWDPEQHPRAGGPPNAGWFAPVAEASEVAPVMPVSMPGHPWDKPWDNPDTTEGGGGGGVPRGQLELPFSGGLPKNPRPSETPASPVAPEGASPRSSSPPAEVQPNLPFPGGLRPQLAPYTPGGKTSGIFYAPGRPPMPLQSGYEGPADDMPPESSGFDGLTLSHVEGHAAALMRQNGIMEATLYINNPKICGSCMRLLSRMLPPGAILNVVLPDNTVIQFIGTGP
jgi:hypothetical protein